jgi:hypothetical protein
MFMDQPITPTRVEALIDLLRVLPGRRAAVPALKGLLQPKGLPGLSPNSDQARKTITAAKEIDLVTEANGEIELAISSRDRRSARDILLDALDLKVLAQTDVEPWFARFYAFLIGRPEDEAQAGVGQHGGQWETRFNQEALKGREVDNRFNKDKYTGFHRWFRYTGLGWYDSNGFFQPNPYERLTRRLPQIFKGQEALDSDEFLHQLSKNCPELDGGAIFLEVNSDYQPERRECTGALSAALVELHLDGVLELECPSDSVGWSLGAVSPPMKGSFLSDRFQHVRLVAGKRGGANA